MDEQRFSVVMSVYINDNPLHFRIALDSIIDQTVPPDEVVLVVDGPVTEELYNIILEYKSRNESINPIYLEQNKGLGNALKVAVERSRNELIARMDSDDISVKDRFERQLRRFQEDEELSILGGSISEFIGTENNVVGTRIVPSDDRDIAEYLKKRCPFNHVTVMFRKSEVLRVGNYRDWFWNEDYYLWVRMMERGCKFGNLPDTLVKVRVGTDMYKRRGGLRYFKSEAAIQKYMLDKEIIGYARFTFNIFVRFIVQVVLPSRIRGFIFKVFARTNVPPTSMEVDLN